MYKGLTNRDVFFLYLFIQMNSISIGRSQASVWFLLLNVNGSNTIDLSKWEMEIGVGYIPTVNDI